MCVVSEVDQLISGCATEAVVQWLDALNPLVIKLKRCVEVMCSRATVGLTFLALQVRPECCFHFSNTFGNTRAFSALTLLVGRQECL